MMKTFKLEIDFKTEMTFKTRRAPSLKNDRYLDYIEEFLSEFIKDKEAVIHYFKDMTAAYLGGPARFQKQLKRLFKLKLDDLSYYLKVADRCRDDVKTFIYLLLTQPQKLDVKQASKDKYLEILLTKFGILKITDASIIEVDKGQEAEGKEKNGKN